MSGDSSSAGQVEPTTAPSRPAWGALEGLFVPIACILLAGLVLGLGVGLSGLDYTASTGDTALWLAAAGVSLPAVILVFYTLKLRRLPLSAFKLSRLAREDYKELAKSFGLYILLSFGLLVAAQLFYSGFDPTQEQELGLEPTQSLAQLGLMFVVLAVLTPLSEELLFRGFMFPGLRTKMGWLPAAIVSAAIFGLLHGQVNVALDTAALGFVSARLMDRTDSLTPSILLHGAKNAIAFGLVFLAPLL